MLEGGAGNDTYYVQDAGDQVIEAPGAGTDRVFAAISHVLAAIAVALLGGHPALAFGDIFIVS